MMSGAVPGWMAYAPLASPVTLAAGNTYYLLTQETMGGDHWYDTNTTLQTTPDATPNASIYGTGTWIAAIAGNRTYGPVDLKYSLGTASGQATQP